MKSKTFFNQIFIGLTMFGTLVGAGFASGKEIWQYFARFGNISYVMICLTGLVFFACSFLFFKFGKTFQIRSVQQCHSKMFGKFSVVGEILLVVSNLILLGSMFAGADSLFQIIVPNLPYRLAGVLTAIICFFVVCFGFRGITKVNAVLVPLLLLVVLVVLFFGLFGGGKIVSPQNFSSSSCIESFVFAMLFVGSNMFYSGFIFARLGKDFSNKEILGGSLIGSAMLVLSLLGITLTLYLSPEAQSSAMPIVFIASNMNSVFAICVLLIVWLGLLTTALALLYTISNWLKTFFGNTAIVTLLATIIAFFLSGIGFSSFVAFVYPAMGVFGIFYVILALFATCKNKKESKKQCKQLEKL